MAPRRSAATAAAVLAGCAGCSAWVATPASRGFTGQRVAPASATPSDTSGWFKRVMADTFEQVVSNFRCGHHVNSAHCMLLAFHARKESRITTYNHGRIDLDSHTSSAWSRVTSCRPSRLCRSSGALMQLGRDHAMVTYCYRVQFPRGTVCDFFYVHLGCFVGSWMFLSYVDMSIARGCSRRLAAA